MHSKPLAGALLVFALALAGCSTQIETQQTEPFRIQLEGDGRTIQLDEDDSEQVQFATCGQEVDTCDVEEVEVAVQVKQASETPCKVKVTIQEKGGAVLETRIIDVGSGSTSANGTATGNGTSNGTATGSTGSGQVIVQNIVVNVKGKDNIVVITEAQQGSAEVNIAAHATGHSSNTVNDDDGTVTATATATSSSTNTTSASNTTTG